MDSKKGSKNQTMRAVPATRELRRATATARAESAGRLFDGRLFDVGEFFSETLDIDFVQLDLVFVRLHSLFDTRIVFFGAQAHVLLFRELLFRGIQQLLLLRQLLLEYLTATRVAAALGVVIDARKIGGVPLRRARRRRCGIQ